MATNAQQSDEESRGRAFTEAMVEALKKSVDEAIEKSMRSALSWHLEKRFGPLPAEVATRIEQARSPDLKRWFDHVYRAPTLADALGSAPRREEPGPSPDSHERALSAPAAALEGEEQSPAMCTNARTLIDKRDTDALLEGIVKGVMKGIKPHWKEILHGALLSRLVHRFGPLPAEVGARVEQAKVADLKRWLKRVYTLPTLAEVLDSTPRGRSSASTSSKALATKPRKKTTGAHFSK